ncbi:hypothetical protein Tco_0028357, partial [Tanacetum coccineum]
KVTSLFDSMLVQNQAPKGEGSVIPPEPQPTPFTSQPNVSEPQTESLQTESLQTETPLTVSYELQTEAHIEQILHLHIKENKERLKNIGEPKRSLRNRYRWQFQAPRNHRGAPAQTRSERVLKQPNEPPLLKCHTSGSEEGRMAHTFELMDIIPPTPHDSPLPGGYTPGSDEGILKLEEFMAMCIKLLKLVLDLEKDKDAQAVEILKLKKRVKKLERQRKSSISYPRRRIYRQIESSDDDLDEEDASKQGRKSDKIKPMFKDSDFDDLVDEEMAFVQEKDVENQRKIGADDT